MRFLGFPSRSNTHTIPTELGLFVSKDDGDAFLSSLFSRPPFSFRRSKRTSGTVQYFGQILRPPKTRLSGTPGVRFLFDIRIVDPGTLRLLSIGVEGLIERSENRHCV